MFGCIVCFLNCLQVKRSHSNVSSSSDQSRPAAAELGRQGSTQKARSKAKSSDDGEGSSSKAQDTRVKPKSTESAPPPPKKSKCEWQIFVAHYSYIAFMPNIAVTFSNSLNVLYLID